MAKQETACFKILTIRITHFIRIMLVVLTIGHELILMTHKCYYPTKMAHL